MIWRALSVAYLTSTVGFAVFAQDLRVPAVPLGDLEPSEMRLTLTAQELQDMGIPDVHAFGFDQAFAVGDLSEIDQVGVIAAHDPGHMHGRIKTALGSLEFASRTQTEGTVRVEFGSGDGVWGLIIDRSNLVATPLYAPRGALTAADKFAVKALAVVLPKVLAAETAESQMLMRTVNLYADLVPVGPLEDFFQGQDITPQEERSWTNICGWRSATLCHDASSHRYWCIAGVAVGPNAYRCRGRCGSSCGGLGSSAWTIDCGEHDHCLEFHGTCWNLFCGSCGNEGRAASDDYVFAPNCRRPGW
jgi:hypothetical protein